MQAFEMASLLAEQQQSGKSWLPFVDVSSALVGVYVVAEDDRETHTPHIMDEVYYVVSGRGRISVAGEEQPIASGSVIFVPAMQQHHFHSIQEPLTLLVFFAKAASV